MNKFIKKKYQGVAKLSILLLLFLTLVTIFNFETAFFWTLFAAFVFFNINAKYTGQGAIALLILVPLLQALDRNAQAEQVAVYAYFLLVITVAVQLIELKRFPNKALAEPNEAPQSQETVELKHTPIPEPTNHAMNPVILNKLVLAQEERFESIIVNDKSLSSPNFVTQSNAELDAPIQEIKVPIEPSSNIVGKDVSKPKRKRVGSEIAKPKPKKTKPESTIAKSKNKKPNQK